MGVTIISGLVRVDLLLAVTIGVMAAIAAFQAKRGQGSITKMGQTIPCRMPGT